MKKYRWDNIEIPEQSLGVKYSSIRTTVKTKTPAYARSSPGKAKSGSAPKTAHNTIYASSQPVNSQPYGQFNSPVTNHGKLEQFKLRTAFVLAGCALIAVVTISAMFAMIKLFTSPAGSCISVLITVVLFLVMMKKGTFFG